MSDAGAVHHKAIEIGKLAVRMTAVAGSGHPSSALSIAHLLTQIMYRRMRWDPANPWNPGNDRLVLSEGHAVPAVYAAYADIGGIVGHDRDDARPLRVSEVDELRQRDSVLDGHPNPAEGFPFFDAATGSLGMGLSVAAGLGLAARLDGSDRRIYCIIGDGESREGQIWEAVDFLLDHELTNVCAIFNANGEGQAGHVSTQQSADKLAAKLEAFGCAVRVVDGHDPDAIDGALNDLGKTRAPLAIVAKTVKGWGCDNLRGANFHGKPLKDVDVDSALESLDRTAAELNASANGLTVTARPASPRDQHRTDPTIVEWPDFAEVMERAGLKSNLEKGKLATRRAYGAALLQAGHLIPQVVVLDGDVSNSTFSEMFAARHPERFFECKIAEQNMVSTAAGLAAAGFIPFANSFAKFIARAYDQVELASISRANVKLVGSHAGVSPAADGPSQMALSDVAYFRSYTTVRGDDRRAPIAWFFQPADAVAACACTKLMLGIDGMCYMRTHRPDVPLLYDASTSFVPGGFEVLRSGEDLMLVGSGYTVHEALRAAELLTGQGVRAGVLDVYSLPVDADRLHDVLGKSGATALVIEDNYGGGVGAAVAEVAARYGDLRVAALTCQRIPKSARTPDEALAYVGVGYRQAADHALALLKQPA